MGRRHRCLWQSHQQWQPVLGMEKQGKTRPAWWKQDAGSEKHEPRGSTPHASTLPESRQHHPSRLEPHRDHGSLDGTPRCCTCLGCLCQPGSPGKSQFFLEACNSHSSTSSTTQPWQPNLWPCGGFAQSRGSPGEPNASHCWWHRTCPQPIRFSWPLSLTSTLGTGNKGANSQKANKSS